MRVARGCVGRGCVGGWLYAVRMPPRVVSVGLDSAHRFSKPPALMISLREGWGVDGDAHAGTTVQHRYLRKKDPAAPNLTQVHLIAAELFDDLDRQGFAVGPGDLGENITTEGIDLISLSEGTRVHVGETAIVEITGLRSPCVLINRFQNGLMKACLGKNEDGTVVRKAGVMGIVIAGGAVSAGDPVRAVAPAGEHRPLRPV
jgi:MOSC domain-containing protein YiiM